MESKFRFKSGVNLVDSEKASFGQLAILAPYGGNVFSEVVKCEDGTVTFTLTKEMIDQLEEVGLYSFQIRLFDYYRESRVSIPPIEFGIEVREPVASEDHDNEVNNAIVGYSIAKVVDGLNEDVPDTFDANGNYNKTDWETGDRITEGKLNKIEDALDKINQNEKADIAAMDKKVNSNFNVLSSEIDTKADDSFVQNLSKSIGNGGPKGVYATVAALTSAKPKGDSNVYVVSADGCWYFWSGSAWTKGGVYQSMGISDGSISYSMWDATLQSNASRVGEVRIHIPHGIPFIDVDFTDRTIKIKKDAVITISRLNGQYFKANMPEGSVAFPETFGTYCMNLIYNITSNNYSLLSYTKGLSADDVILAAIRFSGGATTSDCWYVTVNGGKPNQAMQDLLNTGLISSRFTHPSMRPNSPRYHVFIDRATWTVKVPTGQWMCGSTLIEVEEQEVPKPSYSNTLLYAFYYDMSTGKFIMDHFNWAYKPRDNNQVLVDLIMADNSLAYPVFTKDIFIFNELDCIEYIKIEDMLNFEVYSPARNSIITTYINDENCIFNARSTSYGSYNRMRVRHKTQTGIKSDACRIRKRDKIKKIEITTRNPNYYFAIHAWGMNKETGKFSQFYDSGWKPANIKHNVHVSEFMKSYDTIYIIPFVRRSDDTSIPLSTVENLEATINVIREDDPVTGVVDPTPLSLNAEDIQITQESPARSYITGHIPFDALMHLTLDSSFASTTFNGTSYINQIGVHGFDKNGAKIFDGYWKTQAAQLTRYNPVKGWDSRYVNGTAVSTTQELIDRLATIRLFHCVNKSIDIETYQAYLEYYVTTFNYGVDYTTEEDGVVDIDKALHEQVLESNKSSEENGGGVTNIVSLRDEFIFNASSGQPKFKSIEVPEGYRAFNVEFTAKVVGDGAYGYFRAGGQTINVNNKTYKRFKFRVNKAENVGMIVTPGLTGGSGDLYVKDVKIVPLREDIQVLPHTNNRFYMHRGYSTVYPENSLLAAEEACKRGCSMIELDLFSSTDNKPLFVHDDTIGRTDRNRPTITLSDSSIFTVTANNKITITGSNIAEFKVNDKLVINDNGKDKTAKVTGVSGSIVTVDITNLTGPINSIVNHRRYINTFTEAEFLTCDVGTNKYPEEYNARFDDYLNVLSRYNASFIMDIRSLTEACFKEGMAPLMDRFKYWDNVYFMHSVAAMDSYDKWAGDLGRKIRTAAILWTAGDALINEINTYGAKEYPNTISKDVVLNSPNVTQEAIDLAHSYGMRVMVFTINTVNSAQQLFRMGVDICASDCLSDDNCILW
jgi:glycerophosphoryl diester phosphodiesterase